MKIELALGVVLLISAIFLIVAVLIQNGKSKGLSGAVAGSAETFYGKTKGKTIDKMLSKLTTVVGVIFVLTVLIVYVIQDTPDYKSDETFDKVASNYVENKDTAAPGETEAKSESTSAPASETGTPSSETSAPAATAEN